MSDVRDQIAAVTRRLELRLRHGRDARVLVARRAFDAPAAEVWDAITDRDRIPRWFLPVSGELRVGGHYQLEGNANGVIERCRTPRLLTITWEYAGEVSWLEVTLSSGPAGMTILELTHIIPVDDDRWGHFGPGAIGIGWDLTLLGLDRYLSKDTSATPPEPMTWMDSDEGRAFMTLSGEQWCAASVASGADEQAATLAAARCLAAYTGSPQDDDARRAR
jgi:uncharacterized protein YndB with AHSA1/START domain